MLPSTLNSKLRILKDEEKTGNRLKAIRQFVPDPRSPKEMTEFLTDLYQSGRIAKGNPWGTGAVYLGKRGLTEIPTIKKALTGLDNIKSNLKSNIGRRLAPVTPGGIPSVKINPDSNPNVFFSKTREANKQLLGGTNKEVTKGYQKLQNIQIDPETGRPLAKTATHHISGIADSTAPLKTRVDGDRLLQSARKAGIPTGDELKNYISLPDVLTKGTRVSKVQQLADQFPKVNRRSISDALGASEFSKQPLLKSDEIADRRIWQGVKEQTGLKNPYGEFKPGSTQGPFPSIKLFDANNKLVREWKPTTLKEWGTRWDVINKHYGSNITQDVVNKVKVNPRLNTYGADHKLVHDTLKEVDSFKAIKNLMDEGKWSTLPFNQADVMYKKMLRDQHKVAINMANWRYEKIAQYFKKLNPGKNLSSLSPGEQAVFFKKNISEISSLGSLKELPTKQQLLKNLGGDFKDMLKSNKRRDALEAIFGLKSPVGDLRIRK
tara:strand:- start:43 stop:1515 length:1473 start_codon:yes stop_codon:yes gene_type:complete